MSIIHRKPYNGKFRIKEIIYIVLTIIGVCVVAYCIDYYDFECSKANDTCLIYSKRIFQQREVYEVFKISDIDGYYINEITSRSRYSHRHVFYPVIHLKSEDRLIFMPFDTRSHEKAEDIYSNIFIQPEYKIKGSLFKAFFDLY